MQPFALWGRDLDSLVVEQIRDASRSMARDWGFMGGRFAGVELPPSSVHALIEIDAGCATAKELRARLRLEKSSVSRMLRKLVESGDVQETADEQDSRRKELSLTTAGRQRVAAIHVYARSQVSDALSRLQPRQEQVVLKGLRLYSGALANSVGPQDQQSPVKIVQGYQLGLIARITELHALFYARESGFGQRFESVVAGGLAEFCNRLDKPSNAIWTAVQGGQIAGSIAIDGEDLGTEIAHLRWFIVDDTIRGSGAGRRLLKAALDFGDQQGCRETHLWTFSGLSAARHLYETHGFHLAEERPGAQWGKEVMEQRFVRSRP